MKQTMEAARLGALSEEDDSLERRAALEDAKRRTNEARAMTIAFGMAPAKAFSLVKRVA